MLLQMLICASHALLFYVLSHFPFSDLYVCHNSLLTETEATHNYNFEALLASILAKDRLR